MDASFHLAELGALLASPARAKMLEVLFNGGSYSAIDLAVSADVQPNTASSHLAKLTAAGLIVCQRRGRHRFFRLAGGHVADVVEAINELAPGENPSLSRPLGPMEMARTCYDHLAGRLGTALTDAMIARRQIRARGKDFVLTRSGRSFLTGLDVDTEAAQAQRRLFARRCLDWTERRYHLGGALGAALTRRCFEAGWVRRADDDRIIRVTPKGARAFAEYFEITLTG